jgi:hypothetical protein
MPVGFFLVKFEGKRRGRIKIKDFQGCGLFVNEGSF